MLRTYVPHTFSADALAIIRQANQICAAYAKQEADRTLLQRVATDWDAIVAALP